MSTARRWGWWVLLVGCLLPAATLTVLRLLALEAGPAIRLVSFTPYAVLGYAAGLVLLVAVLRRHVAARPVAVLVVGALVVHGWWLSPLVGPTGAAEAGPGERLVVMSANLLMGRADTAAVVGGAVAAEADLLVVQEVTQEALDGLERAGLEEQLPHRIGYPQPGEPPVADTVGTMVFSRVPLGEPVGLGTVLQSWRVDVDGLVLLAVHPSAPTDPENWVRDHELVLGAARASGADLLVGDLNATRDHAPLRRLRGLGYRDAVAETNGGWQPTWPANGLFRGVPLPLVRIDHVLAGPGLQAVEASTLSIEGTDHRAVLVELVRTAD